MKKKASQLKKAAVVFVVALGLAPLPGAYSAERNKAKDQETITAQKINRQGQRSSGKSVKARVFIKASPHIVWNTIHEQRSNDPDLEYSKVIEQGKNEAVLEQKFALLPIIGTAICVMKNTEIPLKRIDYHLIRSDRFKALEGSWILTPSADGNSCALELSSHLDIGLPFSRLIVENITAKKLQKRLMNVKNIAEIAQMRVAHSEP